MVILTKQMIDSAFENVVLSMGGDLVINRLGPQSSLPDNADFIFPDRDVICELKVLEKDPSEQGGLDEKVQKLFDKWVNEGRLYVAGFRYVDSANLPHEMQWELAKLHSEPVKRVLKKANRQIRETKKIFGLPNAKGHVVIVNDGNRSLEPYQLAFAVHQSLGVDYSNINGVSVLTVNLLSQLDVAPTVFRLWIDYVRDGASPLDRGYLSQLQVAWSDYLATLLTEPLPFVEAQGTDLSKFRLKQGA